ncbi:hypothetical protein Acr_04g0008320 [Actinidia rufa]|uniref:Uncharacterized protein n=1 Tax=Actinidia rufa TaxID=165716 RepID=A0A7J0EHY8_9ERIC|nr:hypothetical protein Acr_04g0008320 [Actinidia rufa]
MVENTKGYAWAISAGLNAALAAISAKLFSYQVPLVLLLFQLKTFRSIRNPS